jgi:hypothetical protein
MSKLALLLVSEDGAKDTQETLESLTKHLLRLVDSNYHSSQVRIEVLKDPQALSAARANRWQSQAPKDRIMQIALVRSLTTWLTTDEDAIILYHMDADIPWSESKAGKIVPKIDLLHQFLLVKLRSIVPARPNEKNTYQALERSLTERLILIMPYYSIEAWLYQNTKLVRQICKRDDQERHAQTIMQWEQDRGILDDLSQPKNAICLSSRHNCDLALGFPAEQVLAVGKSFAATVRRLQENPVLLRALRNTHSTYESLPHC